jgi:FlgD Ig-like domain
VSWTSITGDLPVGVRGLALATDFRVNPDRLYLGTDYGVFTSHDGGVHWVKTAAGFPNVAVFNLSIDPANNYLVAATHGRGMWRATLDVTPPAVAVTSPVGGETWYIGSNQNITWNASDAGGVDSVSLRLSRDGGLSYPTLIAHGWPNNGVFPWTVPGPQSSTCRIQVTAYDPSGNYGSGASPANFVIGDSTVVGVGSRPWANAAPRLTVTNPFRPPSSVRYDLPRRAHVRVEVFDLGGRCLAHLESGMRDAGSHEVAWRGVDDAGRSLPSGTYFCRLTVGDLSQVRHLALLR